MRQDKKIYIEPNMEVISLGAKGIMQNPALAGSLDHGSGGKAPEPRREQVF